jgi:hypothetical protein
MTFQMCSGMIWTCFTRSSASSIQTNLLASGYQEPEKTKEETVTPLMSFYIQGSIVVNRKPGQPAHTADTEHLPRMQVDLVQLQRLKVA